MASNLNIKGENKSPVEQSQVGSFNQSMLQSTNLARTAKNAATQEDISEYPSSTHATKRHESKQHNGASTSAPTSSKSRPRYSRKYSTPPSRPLSPSGFPQILDLDTTIPNLELEHTHQHVLQVDSAPQDPDLWDDPETDYFSTVEGGPVTRHRHQRAKSRAHSAQTVSKAAQQLSDSNGIGDKRLAEISEDTETEFRLPPTPGAWTG